MGSPRLTEALKKSDARAYFPSAQTVRGRNIRQRIERYNINEGIRGAKSCCHGVVCRM